MDEHVLAAVIRSDKAKTLGGIEKLHGADGHFVPLKHRVPPARYARTAVETKHSGRWKFFGSSGTPFHKKKSRSERQKRFV
jgi:hypothetical protein